ncbi:hypothetical protein D3C71_1085060 [compost metagenome]
MQRFQQHALVVAHALAGVAGGRARVGVLHAATALGPAIGEAPRPGGGGGIVRATQRFGVQRIDQVVQLVARGRRARRRAPWRRHLRHHSGGGQLLVQGFIPLADRCVQVALAQLDQHQPHFRGQFTVGERLVDGHADVLGADRIAVGIEFQATGDPAEAAVQPRQDRLPVTQQHRGEVAHGQPRLQHMLGDQAEPVLDLPGQGGLGGRRLATLQRIPSFEQVTAEAAHDVFAAAAQFAHAVQEQQLRRACGTGTVEQDVVKARQHRRKRLGQRRQCGVAGLPQQRRVTTRLPRWNGRGDHAKRLPSFAGTECSVETMATGAPQAPASRWQDGRPVRDNETVRTLNLMTGVPAGLVS